MDREYQSQIDASVRYLKSRIMTNPTVGIVLGSGLGDFGEQLVERVTVDAKEIPYYPVSSVPGHAGRLLVGKIPEDGRTSNDVLVFQGRVHFYESDDTGIVVYPIEVAHSLGIRRMIVTNAAGGISQHLAPGDLMFITDYINFTFENPLIGRPPREMMPRSLGFSQELLSRAKSIAMKNNIPFKDGVYCWTKGPTYESAAEIRMMKICGADAVGMSTVPEVILAASYGMQVLGISCVTNLATGLTPEKLSHNEVANVATTVKHHFARLLSKIVLDLAED